PFIRDIYRYYGAEDNVANVHLANEGHDYGPSKREAMYRFVAPRLGLDLSEVLDANGAIDETKVTIEPHEKMHFFDDTHPVPERAMRTAAAVEAVLKELQR
ncbi:MAG TPA: hypothetical protein VEA63_07320, partial [Opitutus sp.]|nr:hypothetical protein [Opitutus sp.]